MEYFGEPTQGILEFFMEIDALMFSMEFHGKCPNLPCKSFPWKSMEKFPSNSMKIDVLILHGISWRIFEFHGIPWRLFTQDPRTCRYCYVHAPKNSLPRHPLRTIENHQTIHTTRVSIPEVKCCPEVVHIS